MNMSIPMSMSINTLIVMALNTAIVMSINMLTLIAMNTSMNIHTQKVKATPTSTMKVN